MPRARLFFLVAVVIAAGILVTNFPLGTLLHERATVQGETARLATLRETNEKLALEVRALDEPATIGQIAHEEYGLVTPGERPIVVLPASGGAGSSARDPLANNPIPSSDLLPSDAILDPGTQITPPPAHGPGFWRRVLGAMEFWHSLF
jgi:cell division protein FtsB